MTEESLSDLAKATLYSELRYEIRKLAHQMEGKFRIHEDRGSPFQPCSWKFLNERLSDEDRELEDAMIKGERPSVVWAETADVCNFYLMCAVKYERDWLRGKKDRKSYYPLDDMES